MEFSIFNFATVNLITRFKHTVPIWFTTLFANDAKELTLQPCDFCFFYSLADKVFRGDHETWEIGDRIDRQRQSGIKLWHCPLVGALADVCNPGLINEPQGSKDIADGPILKDDTRSNTCLFLHYNNY